MSIAPSTAPCGSSAGGDPARENGPWSRAEAGLNLGAATPSLSARPGRNQEQIDELRGKGTV
ncbi:MAG: hypothetical protein K2X11_14680 [Acetobacteraceae bacterium]|nr:hypothetical protein [Acetobacteraceae bacterium]